MADENTGVRDAEEVRADRRTERIRSEIEQTRADMSETIDEIQDRLRPANVMARARDSVREATVGRVKQMARSATRSVNSGRYDYTTRGGGIADRIRENPIPMGLVVGSVAWMALRGNGRGRRRPAIYGSTRGGEAFVRETTITDEMPEAGWDDEAVGRGRSMARAASDRVRGAAHRAENGLERLMRDNPLAAGAIAAAVGITIGLSLPETERENELMGEARDSVVHRAREAARDAADRVQDAAQRVKDVAGEAAESVLPRE